MLYQLPTGKVIDITVEQFLEMTDEELEYLIAYNYGEGLEDPWFASVLKKGSTSPDIEDIILEITDIPQNEKLLDLDVDEGFVED